MQKVSLILTTFNCSQNLIKTLESIEMQDYPEIEVVIKDGCSTDDTINIIKKYKEESHFPVVWQSTKDTGIYDAMNQGYHLCSGDIIAFFNDVFIRKDCVSKLVKKMEEVNPVTKGGYQGVHADLVYADEERIIRKWKMGEGSISEGWMPAHPTLFLRRDMYEKYGLYNTKFRIAADYEFMIRFLKDNENQLAYLPEIMVSMFYGGTSSGGLKNYLISFKEGYQAVKMNRVKGAFLINVRRSIKVLLQFVQG